MCKKILINGYFLCRKRTGVERYAYEVTARLDGLIAFHEAAIIVPTDLEIPPYKNIHVIRYKKIIPHIFWQMFTLQWFLLTHREYTVLDFGNTCLPLAPGIIFLHDIYCEFFPEDFTSVRDKVVRLYNKWQYRLIARKAKKIITVSCFSRNEIVDTYHVDSEKIAVIYNGWEHFSTIVPDYTVFDEHPELRDKSFFFTMGSFSKRKNIRWIDEYAAKHLDAIFAISGAPQPTTQAARPGANGCIMLGYLDDAKVKALMEKCKAFILPSYYEGFGIPPLEALSCGAPVIIANAASLPEIYGNTAHYLDPFNTDIDLDALLNQPVEPPDRILKKYSYDTAARQVLDILRSI
jgi:glycosyltransferase involved in cell wall biosynthesis